MAAERGGRVGAQARPSGKGRAAAADPRLGAAREGAARAGGARAGGRRARAAVEARRDRGAKAAPAAGHGRARDPAARLHPQGAGQACFPAGQGPYRGALRPHHRPALRHHHPPARYRRARAPGHARARRVGREDRPRRLVQGIRKSDDRRSRRRRVFAHGAPRSTAEGGERGGPRRGRSGHRGRHRVFERPLPLFRAPRPTKAARPRAVAEPQPKGPCAAGWREGRGSKMNPKRQPPFLVLCICALSGALLAVRVAQAARDPAGPYKKLDVFSHVLSLIENNYVEQVDETRLLYGAIEGMVRTLDPHSTFMDPRSYASLKQETEGEYGGVGLELTTRGDDVVVVAPLDDTPASRAGFAPGDRLVEIDGQPLRGWHESEGGPALMGPPGGEGGVKALRAARGGPGR